MSRGKLRILDIDIYQYHAGRRRRLAALNPGVLVPAHCTGWRAQHAMSARFPAAFVPNTVGTSFHL